jgi:phosphate transport system substrate-binding protein
MKRNGRCSNYGECPKADNKEVIEVADEGENFTCPVCGSDLEEAALSRGGGKKGLPIIPIAIGVILLALVGGLIFYLFAQGPPAPKNLQATAQSPNLVALSWEGTPTDSTTKIERSTTSGEGFNLIAETAPGLSSSTDNSAAAKTIYYYRVRFHRGSSDSAYSSEAMVTTPAETEVPSPFPEPSTPPITPPPAPTPTPPPLASEPVLFRLAGSNTIGAELAPAWAEAFLRKKGARDVKQISIGPDHISVQGVLPGQSSAQSIDILSKGSATGFTALGAAQCEIAMSSRPVKPEEVDSLKEKGLGDMNSPECDNVVGVDGIAVIVNSRNPINSLSIDQLRQIFSGSITDWSQIGGSPGPISIFLRETASGTRDLFQSLVLKKDTFSSAASIPGTGSNNDVSQAVAEAPGGIGFLGLPYVGKNKALAVADGNAAPIQPSVATIKSEAYPLGRRLHLYIAANLTNTWAKEYVQFAVGTDGQNIVDEQNFVGLNLKLVHPQPPPDAPPGYKKMTANLMVLDINIRFLTGLSTLDNRAVADIGRIVEFMKRPENRSFSILLIGFADSAGSFQQNVKLSESRAETVKQALRSRGLAVVSSTGFGSAAPVASNDTPEGREKNRRVEIWVGK